MAVEVRAEDLDTKDEADISETVAGLPIAGIEAGGMLREEYQDAQLDLRTKICPHWAVDLSEIEPDEHGVIRCPGHGLRFCARTGKAVWSYNNSKKGSRT